MNNENKLVKFIFFIVIVLCVLLFKNSYRNYKIEKNGVIDTAIITGIASGPKGSFYLQYKFVTNGIEYKGHVLYDILLNNYAQTGDYFLVKYIPKKPSENKLIKCKNGKYCKVFTKMSDN